MCLVAVVPFVGVRELPRRRSLAYLDMKPSAGEPESGRLPAFESRSDPKVFKAFKRGKAERNSWTLRAAGQIE